MTGMSTFESRMNARHREAEPVTVVGAGPAGLACAIGLARAGRRVVVREWHSHVGARFHGDFQGIENWSDERDVLDELAAAGIRAAFDHHPVSEATAYDSRGISYRLQSQQTLYYLVRRGAEEGCLDRNLLHQATEAGAEVRFGDRMGEIEGTAVLAIGPRSAQAIAAGYVFETDMRDGSWLALDNRLAPLGYAYLLVHDGRGTVASCMFTGFKRQAAYVERTVAFFKDRVRLEMRNPRPFGGFANFRLPRTAVQGGHPMIGEQAGFQDALAGFGIRYAMRSGLLAAQSIIEATDYARLWQRDLLPLLRTGTVNRFLFNLVGESGWRLALRALSRGNTRLTLRWLYQSSALRRALFPIARLRYRSQLRDSSCDHVDCHCVWCECQSEAKASALR
jgi:flavin-dependent dehydrogenase